MTNQIEPQMQEKTPRTLKQSIKAFLGLLIVLAYVVIGTLVSSHSLITTVLFLLVMVSGMTVYIYYSLPDSNLKNQKEEGCPESDSECSS